MVKVCQLKDIPREQHQEIQALVDNCMAHEEAMNTGKICWFISDRFYQRFKNKWFIVEKTKEDGIRGAAILHLDKKNMVCLSHLYVKCKHRNKGAATSILKTAINFAKKNGRKLFLNVNPRNAVALKLYSSLGFVPKPDQYITMAYNG